MEAEAETSSCATIDDIGLNVELEMCKQVADLARNMVDLYKLQGKSHDGFLLDVAVMCQAHLPTIQHLYESEPEKLNRETLNLACRYGAKPGVIPFLAKKKPEFITNHSLCRLAQAENGPNPGDLSLLARLKPEAVSVESDHWQYPISFAMTNGVDESEIRTLVQIWPECVITQMCFSFGEGILSTPLEECLASGYSNELLQFMISKFPDTTIDEFEFGFRNPFQARDLLWLKPIFKKCQGKIDCRGFLWKGPNFHDFLGLCFLQTDDIKEMLINLPTELRGYEEDKVASSMVDFKKKYLLPNQQSHPKIEKLWLKFSHGSYCGLLDLLHQWPSLRELELFVKDQLGPSMAALCHLLKHGQLKHLRLEASEDAFRSRKRKGDSQEVEMPLRPLFLAIATNQTVQSLTISGIANDDEKRGNCELLVEALKQNTVLEKVNGFQLEQDDHPNQPKRLNYYLRLNRCGRKHARDATIPLREFVSLLGAVESKLRRHANFDPDLSSSDIVAVQYVLLREAVSKWN